MRKYRPPLTSEELKDLDRLENLNFSTYSEADVREEFLVPILTILGYRKDLDYSVSREESFKLHKPFLQVGSNRVRLDYIFSIRKQYFWLIDAKEGKCSDTSNPPQIADEAITQAFFYSHHHEVNCKYFVISNGWFFNIYDRDTLDDSLTPILSIKNSELKTRFMELDSILGSTQLLPHLKTNVLKHIKDILSAEMNLERIPEFQLEVKNACNEIRPKVLENFRRNYAKEASENSEAWKSYIASERISKLVETIFNGFTMGEIDKASLAMTEALKGESNSAEQYLFFNKLFLRELRFAPYSYFFNVMFFLGVLDHKGIKEVNFPLPDGGSIKRPTKEILNDWIDLIITGFEERPELRLLGAFEKLFLRMFKFMFIMAIDGRQKIQDHVELGKYLLPEEKVAFNTPCPAGVLLTLVKTLTYRICSQILVKYYDSDKREFKIALAMHEYQYLLQNLNKTTEENAEDYLKIKKELGSGWSELLFIDGLGVDWDPLLSSVFETLKGNPELSKEVCKKHKDLIGKFASLKVANYIEDVCKREGVDYLTISDPAKLKIARQKYFDPNETPSQLKLSDYL